MKKWYSKLVIGLVFLFLYLPIVVLVFFSFNDSKLNILHPYLFLYTHKSDDRKSKSETEIAIFFRDVFFKDIENFEGMFSSKESDNVILKLILNNQLKPYLQMNLSTRL